jgi:hypothetical protein
MFKRREKLKTVSLINEDSLISVALEKKVKHGHEK